MERERQILILCWESAQCLRLICQRWRSYNGERSLVWNEAGWVAGIDFWKASISVSWLFVVGMTTSTRWGRVGEAEGTVREESYGAIQTSCLSFTFKPYPHIHSETTPPHTVKPPTPHWWGLLLSSCQFSVLKVAVIRTLYKPSDHVLPLQNSLKASRVTLPQCKPPLAKDLPTP